MTTILLVSCIGMITGFFIVFGISPMAFTEGIFGRLTGKPKTLRDEINETTLAAAKEYQCIGHCRDLSTVQSRLYHGFKSYQNRGRLENKLGDIRSCLVSLFSSPKIETTGAKESHALQLETLAKECLKGAVLSEIAVQQTAEERQVSTMMMA